MAELSDIANEIIRDEIEEFLENPVEIERFVELFSKTRPMMQELAVAIIDPAARRSSLRSARAAVGAMR